MKIVYDYGNEQTYDEGGNILIEVVKRDEIINFNGHKFECLIEQELPKIVTKQYLLYLCSEKILKEL